MASQSLAPYPLALLQLMEGPTKSADERSKSVDEPPKSAEMPPLGYATRIGVEKSMFKVQAHRILLALIQFSPSPNTIAAEFLTELDKCGDLVVKNLSA